MTCTKESKRFPQWSNKDTIFEIIVSTSRAVTGAVVSRHLDPRHNKKWRREAGPGNARLRRGAEEAAIFIVTQSHYYWKQSASSLL